MVADLDMARSLCVLDPHAESAALLASRALSCSPAADRDAAVADGSGPGMPDLGLMLPYTPLHHLLMAKVARPLVMSSGNQSDDPIAHTDEDAFARLGPMVDGVLAHDRRIHIRCDDSVVRASGRRLQMVRRSRGYVPEAMPLPREAARQVLAVGAELKSTVSVAKQSFLVCSHHIGDLEHLATYQAFLQATVHLCRLFGIEPEVVAHDLHPEYLSTKYALELDLEPWPVQHHHAHIASCLAEHGHTGTVLGIAFDGLGYGTDGTMWGGEFLVADFNGFERVGAPAARSIAGWDGGHPRAMADGAGLDRARRRSRRRRPARRGARSSVEPGPRSRWRGRREAPARSSPPASAVCSTPSPPSLACDHRSPTRARPRSSSRCSRARCPGHRLRDTRLTSSRAPSPGDLDVLDPSPLVATVLSEVERGTDRSVIAAGFHEGLGRATAALGARLARRHGLDTVALSGGVFQNVRFSDIVEDALAAEGLTVLVHESVPPNDGGISVGQAAIAALGTRLPD